MIEINNILTISGQRTDLVIPSQNQQRIDANGLTLLPALIDPHVHFRTPGLENKEDWKTAARASIAGGYTTVFDMPNTLPPTITAQYLQEKKTLIDQQLQTCSIPLRYQLYFGADKNHLAEIPEVKNNIIGIKVFMGCSTGNLVIDDDESLHAVFAIAAQQQLLVAVHAEDQALLHARKNHYPDASTYSSHSILRDPEVAATAVAKAINLARQYQVRLYILHVSTQVELELIAAAKQEGLPVFAETTPHHLFLNDLAYAKWGGKVVVNPPVRSAEQQAALFNAIKTGIIDTLGTDHAPHTEQEKALPYPHCPSGIPSIELALPLLLNAYHDGYLTLEHIVALTSSRAGEIFNLPATNDWVLVDLAEKKLVSNVKLHTKCNWSPYADLTLQGWPVYTILQEHVFDLKQL